MNSNHHLLNIKLLAGNGFSVADAEEATRLLCDELNNIPRIALKMAECEPAPIGSKSVSFSVTEMIIAVGGAGVLPSVITTIREWLLRQPPATTIKIRKGDFEVEWSGTTPPDHITQSLARLLDAETG